MINQQLLKPESIVVVGGSNNVHKPGGAIVRNLLQGNYQGTLRIINPKEDEVQGIKVYHNPEELPPTDMAILVVAAKFCPGYVEYLAKEKNVRAFIIISAGFGEETKEGAVLEQQVLDTCEKYGASLIGPNCIGVMTNHYHGVFTKPVPVLSPKGADFISGSGATAVFILESAVQKGLQFNSVWSIGNGKQIGIEDVLQYMDEHFDPEHDSRIKLLYIENISNPDKFLLHASNLISKGCRIAAVKAGSSASGSRAASSHTGAIASSDSAVDALFRKAGIVRCYGREELTTVGCIFWVLEEDSKLREVAHPKLDNFAIVTHAGGPGVMLTDALSKGGMNIPAYEGEGADRLKANLLPGSSVHNPIDILDKKIRECSKPIFPILPCLNTAGPEVAEFLSKGHVNFADEVTLATALAQVRNTPKPAKQEMALEGVDVAGIRRVIDGIKENGYIAPQKVRELLSCAGIPMVPEFVSADKEELIAEAEKMGYPIVAKVVGPVHKSDVGGVTLNIRSKEHLASEFDRMMQIKDANSVMIQKMISGMELFIGAKYEDRFGHIVLCGLGGIFVEALKDVSSGLAPLTMPEAESMIRSLRGYKIMLRRLRRWTSTRCSPRATT